MKERFAITRQTLLRQSPTTQRGQTAVEFIVIFMLFAALMTGLFEMTRVFRAKLSLNNATFMAARIGIVNHALLDPMNAELENGMVEMFMRGDRSVEGLVRATARARAYGAALRLPVVDGGIKIVSPTRHIFDQLSINQRVHRRDEESYDIHAVIPNDNLRWRPRRNASVEGGGSINLQDANLLKVRSLWCHRLIVPLLDEVIFDIANSLGNSVNQARCAAFSEASRSGNGGEEAVVPGYHLAIVADATLRMQSAVVADDLP